MEITHLLWLLGGAVLLAGLTLLGFLLYVYFRYQSTIIRIFEEKPLFLKKFAPKTDFDVEDTTFKTEDGLTLAGSYIRTSAPERKGVILYLPEYGAGRMTCLNYAKTLVEQGFDLFTFDFRNMGDSESEPKYIPLQWVTNHEVMDAKAAVAHLKERFDAPSPEEGIGMLGISRGAGVAVIVASKDPWVRCVVTDGMFGTINTMIHYMQKWIEIYGRLNWLRPFLPSLFYRVLSRTTLWAVQRRRHCTFPSMKYALGRLSPRPLLMIHGEADSYIRAPIAEGLYRLAREPKELWLVEGAKHNQAVLIQPEEYAHRLRDFFERHLAPKPAAVPESPPLALGLQGS